MTLRISKIFILFLLSFETISQNNLILTLKGTNTYIKINQNDSLHIPGKLKAEEDTYNKNWGTIFLGDSLINNTKDSLFIIETYAGSLHYISYDTFNIAGNSIALIHLINDSTHVLVSEKGLLIFGDFIAYNPIILKGNIKLALKNYKKLTARRGRILNETNNKYIYNTLNDTGYVYAVNVHEDSFSNLGLRIFTSSGTGNHNGKIFYFIANEPGTAYFWLKAGGRTLDLFSLTVE